MFIQTKKQAHRMHIVLGLLGVNVGELHGNLSQAQVRSQEQHVLINCIADVEGWKLHRNFS